MRKGCVHFSGRWLPGPSAGWRGVWKDAVCTAVGSTCRCCCCCCYCYCLLMRLLSWWLLLLPRPRLLVSVKGRCRCHNAPATAGRRTPREMSGVMLFVRMRRAKRTGDGHSACAGTAFHARIDGLPRRCSRFTLMPFPVVITCFAGLQQSTESSFAAPPTQVPASQPGQHGCRILGGSPSTLTVIDVAPPALASFRPTLCRCRYGVLAAGKWALAMLCNRGCIHQHCK